MTLSGWDTRERYVYSPVARRDRLRTQRAQRTHPLMIVSLALRVGSPHLLVPAYLDLARFPVSEIIRGYPLVPSTSSVIPNTSSDHDGGITSHPTLHLPTLQTAAVLRGKETLQRFIADFIKASVEDRVQSPLCRYIEHPVQGDPVETSDYPCARAFARMSRELLVMTAGVSGGVDSDPLFVLKCAVEMLKEGAAGVGENGTNLQGHSPIAMGADLGRDVSDDDPPEVKCQFREEHIMEAACVACTESFKQTVDVARQHIWDCLPKWFDLRKFIENGFEAGWE